MVKTGKKHRKKCRVVIIGMMAGMILGLLFAPRPGTETIHILTEPQDSMVEKLMRVFFS